MEKVIFLDFDGVLNSVKWMTKLHESGEKFTSFLSRSFKELDPAAVKLVSDLAVETNSAIIVSSSWRILHPLHEICDILAANGMNENVLPRGTTPHHGNFRGDEVRLWLSQNPHIGVHVIFDDDGDFHPDQPLVKTSWEEGLLEAHIDIARGILLNIE
jgi:hypothetical protein